MRTIINWPRRQKRSLQITVDVDVDLIEKACVATIADELVEAVPNTHVTESEPKPRSRSPERRSSDRPASAGRLKDRLTPATRERVAVPHALSRDHGEKPLSGLLYLGET
ncbi:hypothetical protein CR51_03865 [Caballeronia megalochromosomata]|nr:hypothetical protein CR51_03865 [Caballeronia megalochromosomata]